jgi:predicted ATPase/DNA-binding SARP family transcriptional activator
MASPEAANESALTELRTELPFHLTRFIGRQGALSAVTRLLSECRLLTLTGAGGSGKTRLALEVAREVSSRSGHELWWVELGALSDENLVSQQVARSLHLIDESGRSPEMAVIEKIGHRPTLLVLDNCEHLVDATAGLVERFLAECPALRILATSREALGVSGETAWLVPPLTVPERAKSITADELLRHESAELFQERARGVLPAFEITDANADAVAAICNQLDGIPLAIELAAARIKVLTPRQIADRLADCFSVLASRGRGSLPRHQTIRETIDWSYRSLTPAEKRMLQGLSVFAGGFVLEAAEEICVSGDIDAGHVLDLVASLVERSLLTVHERGDRARYYMLEVVRQYAAGHLAHSGEASLYRRRHAGYYARMVALKGPMLDNYRAPEELDAIELEYDNYRRALRYWIEAREEVAACSMAGYLGPYWLWRLQWSEGLMWLRRALDLSEPGSDGDHYARALHEAGMIACVSGISETDGEAWSMTARELWRRKDHPEMEALALMALVQALFKRGEKGQGMTWARESVDLARVSGNPYVLVITLNAALSFAHAYMGDPEQADRFLAEAQDLSERIDYSFGLLLTSFSRGMTAWIGGDMGAAARHARSSAKALRRIGVNGWGVSTLMIMAGVAAHERRFVIAGQLCGAWEAVLHSVGGKVHPLERPFIDRAKETARHAIGQEAFDEACAAGRKFTVDQAITLFEETLAADATDSGASSGSECVGVGSMVDTDVRVAVGSEKEAGADLVVRALGPLEIYREGSLLVGETWTYAKPRELLLFLLSRVRGATKDEIGEVLWPDSSSVQKRNNFHVTLHSLRKTLGSADWIVHVDDLYRLNPDRSIDFDAKRFMRTVRRLRKGNEPEDQGLLESTAALYRGEFLVDQNFGEWVLEWRDECQSAYLDVLQMLAVRAFDEGRIVEAMQTSEVILNHDDLREEAHRLLMICLAKKGDRSRALRQYKKLETMLRDHLDAEPDEETIALARSLRSGIDPSTLDMAGRG